MIIGPVTLLIIDGFGDGRHNAYDAPFVANMSNFNRLRGSYASTQINTSGECVGLPKGQFGNSEVGHMNIGAGRVIWQDLTRINHSIATGEYQSNVTINAVLQKLKLAKSRLHLMGLVSDGGVHSHIDHLLAIAKLAQSVEVPTTIHAFLDGRDTEQKSALKYIELLNKQLGDCSFVNIGSICGRYYSMDRDNNWDRIERIWRLLVDGVGEETETSAQSGILSAYGRGETDEFIRPTKLNFFKPISDNDGVLFFNFRADRARQLSHALVNPKFDRFKRNMVPKINLVTFTDYDNELTPYVSIVYPTQNLVNILGELVANSGLKQLRIAETEKYAHVTYFFNCGREIPFQGEERILIPSPKVGTYEHKPEMSMYEVVRELIKFINDKEYKFLVCNLANPDMVGHTGNISAAISACSAVDDAVRQISNVILRNNGALLIISDHGNCECMLDDKGCPHTAHTSNLVPAILVSNGFENSVLRSGGTLADIAPTILKLLGLHCPAEMSGSSLF